MRGDQKIRDEALARTALAAVADKGLAGQVRGRFSDEGAARITTIIDPLLVLQ